MASAFYSICIVFVQEMEHGRETFLMHLEDSQHTCWDNDICYIYLFHQELDYSDNALVFFYVILLQNLTNMQLLNHL